MQTSNTERALTATERFKRLYADAVERVCVLEAIAEQRGQRIAELEAELEAAGAAIVDAELAPAPAEVNGDG